MVFKMKKIINTLICFFSKKNYVTEYQKIGYDNYSSKEKSLKKIDKEISNNFLENNDFNLKEKKRKIEILVLNDILKEDKNYYNQEELEVIINNLSKKEVLK